MHVEVSVYKRQENVVPHVTRVGITLRHVADQNALARRMIDHAVSNYCFCLPSVAPPMLASDEIDSPVWNSEAGARKHVDPTVRYVFHVH
jgi:hypothetical protein